MNIKIGGNQMDVHPPQKGAIGSAPWPNEDFFGRFVIGLQSQKATIGSQEVLLARGKWVVKIKPPDRRFWSLPYIRAAPF